MFQKKKKKKRVFGVFWNNFFNIKRGLNQVLSFCCALYF
ncbi:hypothetical protein HPOKI673_07985 [Helicobacter pylori oki673]|nr:hypothetical protein HPOKI673_07985 [Helicobacter pylori oki673]